MSGNAAVFLITTKKCDVQKEQHFFMIDIFFITYVVIPAHSLMSYILRTENKRANTSFYFKFHHGIKQTQNVLFVISTLQGLQIIYQQLNNFHHKWCNSGGIECVYKSTTRWNICDLFDTHTLGTENNCYSRDFQITENPW